MGQPEPAAEWVATDRLIPWESNPRRNDHAVEQVAASIERFGFASPIIARPGGEVIAGHTRLKAAQQLGLEEVPVRYLDLTDTEARALAIADNRLGELADWDDDGLAEVMRSIQADGGDLGDLGWDDEALAEALGDEPAPPADDEAPEVQAEVHSKPGEVYELGPHRLICGDCRSAEDVARLLDGASVNVAFTSPPYASQRKYDESSGFKPIPPDEYVDWFEAVQANVRQHLADDGSWFVNIKEHCEDGQRSLYVKDLTIAHVRRWAWRFVDELVWAHGGLPGAWPNRFKNAFEPILHFSRCAGIVFNPSKVAHSSDACFHGNKEGKRVGAHGKVDGKIGWSGNDVDREAGLALPSNVLRMPNTPASRQGTEGHGATFPLGLPTFFIKAFSDPGDVIFDPFLGSGTTLIAAAQHGRIGYGAELSPGYCDVIRRRWTRYATEHSIDPGPGALDG